MPNEPTIAWDYPDFVIEREGGLHAIEGSTDDGTPLLAVAVFGSEGAATRYVASHKIHGRVAGFSRASEFHRFLSSIKAPTSHVVFNPTGEGATFSVEWDASIDALLASYFPTVFTWKYPLFVLKENGGYTSLNGTTDGGREMNMLCVFTDDDLANRYMAAADVAGPMEPIGTAAEFGTFLRSLSVPCNGVIFDPVSAAPGSKGPNSMEMASLLALLPV